MYLYFTVHVYTHTHTRKHTHINTQVGNDGKVLVWENSMGNLEISGKTYRCIHVCIYKHSKVKIYVYILIHLAKKWSLPEGVLDDTF